MVVQKHSKVQIVSDQNINNPDVTVLHFWRCYTQFDMHYCWQVSGA